MESSFVQKCNSVLDQLEKLKRDVKELKLMHLASVKVPEPPLLGSPHRFDFDKFLPIDTVMPSDELVMRCKEYSERKYSSKRLRSQTR